MNNETSVFFRVENPLIDYSCIRTVNLSPVLVVRRAQLYVLVYIHMCICASVQLPS